MCGDCNLVCCRPAPKQEMSLKQQGATTGSVSTLYDLKETLQILFVMLIKQVSSGGNVIISLEWFDARNTMLVTQACPPVLLVFASLSCPHSHLHTPAPCPHPGRQNVNMHSVCGTAAAPDDEPALTLFIHGGVRRLPDGRPLLHVSCVDHDRAMRLYPKPASRRAPVARCQRPCGAVRVVADWKHLGVRVIIVIHSMHRMSTSK